MTKRTLYAQLAAALLAVALPSAAFPQPAAGGPPCASCLAITIRGGQKLLLPEDLHGLTVLIRVPSFIPHALPVDAVAEVARRGGHPVVLVVPFETSAVPDRLAYRLKLFLTGFRSEVPAGVPVALDAGHPAVHAVVAELSPYVDVVVGPESLAATGRRVWPLVPARDVREALAATTRGGFERWVIDIPEDVVHARALIHTVIERVKEARAGIFEDVEVRGARRLSVGEIIARHQAAARRQRDSIDRTIATGVLTLTFEAPGFPAPVTITADTTIYADRERTDLAQQRIRVNGIEFRGGGVPRLPILEPERVASPPLTITLTDVYRYRLEGEGAVNGMPAYTVSFEPVDPTQALFRGRAWIAKDSFAMLRVAATQTGLRGAIVSSEQIDEFRQVRPDVWLLAKSDVRQIYEGASHRTPIHRVLTIDAHAIDPPDFAARRDAAYASDALLLRDTAEGYRYLRRSPPQPGATSPTLEVAGPATRVRTLAAGVIIDPNISRPLPFAGVSYVDFDFLESGTQLSAFFGGAYGQLAVAVPSIAGSRWQLGGRGFVIASSYNDRSFRGGREIYEENLRQRPAHVSAWLLRPLTPRVSLRLGYGLEYTRLRAAPETTASFTVPSDQWVHALQVALEGQRAGWNASVWWHPARRAGWRSWGPAGDYDPRTTEFARYGLSVSRSTAWTPRLTSRIDGHWMDGHDLDRFSRYAFGTFDNRLRGYPSALVRYDRGAVARGALAWSLSKMMRIDAFADTAAVRDRGYGSGFRNYTGIGVAAEAPVPFGVLAAVEWGYGFRGVNADGELGTHVIRVSAFKVF